VLSRLNLTPDRHQQQAHLKRLGVFIALQHKLQFPQVVGITEKMLEIIVIVTFPAIMNRLPANAGKIPISSNTPSRHSRNLLDPF